MSRSPTLKCASKAELLRVQRWLEASGMPWMATPCDLEISLGAEAPGLPGHAPLSVLMAGPELLSALKQSLALLDDAYSQCTSGSDLWRTYPLVQGNARNAIARAEGGRNG